MSLSLDLYLAALALAAATELEISKSRTGRRKLADEELGSAFGIELAEAPRAPSKVAKASARKTRATVAKGRRKRRGEAALSHGVSSKIQYIY